MRQIVFWIVFFEWVTLNERKWEILRECRGRQQQLANRDQRTFVRRSQELRRPAPAARKKCFESLNRLRDQT